MKSKKGMEINMINENCFGYNPKKDKCNALINLECEGCKWAKTKEQYKEDRKQAAKHNKEHGIVRVVSGK